MKKQLLCMAAAMMAVSAFSATSVFAAEGDVETKVTYDNRDVAIEGDPETAEWGVAVPSKIQFTDDKRTADVSVELVGYNGYTMEQLAGQSVNGDKFVATVSVKSENNFKLALEGGADKTAYKLNYNAGVVDNDIKANGTNDAAVVIGDLGIIGNGDNAKGQKKEGIATLTQLARENGEHTDKLTFSVTSNLTNPNPGK